MTKIIILTDLYYLWSFGVLHSLFLCCHLVSTVWTTRFHTVSSKLKNFNRKQDTCTGCYVFILCEHINTAHRKVKGYQGLNYANLQTKK